MHVPLLCTCVCQSVHGSVSYVCKFVYVRVRAGVCACCMLRQMREGKRKWLLIYPLRTKCWCGHQRLTSKLSATDNDNENHSRGKKRVQALCSSVALPFVCIFLQMDRKLARKSVLVACPEIWRAIWIAYVWIISSMTSCLSAFAFMIHLYSGFSSGFNNMTCWGNYASSLMPQAWTRYRHIVW